MHATVTSAPLAAVARTPRRQRAGIDARSLRAVFGVLTGVAIVFLIVPTIVMLLTSFTASESLRFPPQGYSLRWYQALLDADQMQAAAWSSRPVSSSEKRRLSLRISRRAPVRRRR